MSIFRHYFFHLLSFLWTVRFFFRFPFIIFFYKFGAFLLDSPFCASAQNTSLFLYISNKSASLSSTFFSFSFLYPGTALFFFIFGKVAFLSAKKELQNQTIWILQPLNLILRLQKVIPQGLPVGIPRYSGNAPLPKSPPWSSFPSP